MAQAGRGRRLGRLEARLLRLGEEEAKPSAPTPAEVSAAQEIVLQALRQRVEAVAAGQPVPPPSEEHLLALEVLRQADEAAGILTDDPEADTALASRLAMVAERTAEAERLRAAASALAATRVATRARGVRAGSTAGHAEAPTTEGTLEAKPPERMAPHPLIGGDLDYADPEDVMDFERRMPPGSRFSWRERPR